MVTPRAFRNDAPDSRAFLFTLVARNLLRPLNGVWQFSQSFFVVVVVDFWAPQPARFVDSFRVRIVWQKDRPKPLVFLQRRENISNDFPRSFRIHCGLQQRKQDDLASCCCCCCWCCCALVAAVVFAVTSPTPSFPPILPSTNPTGKKKENQPSKRAERIERSNVKRRKRRKKTVVGFSYSLPRRRRRRRPGRVDVFPRYLVRRDKKASRKKEGKIGKKETEEKEIQKFKP